MSCEPHEDHLVEACGCCEGVAPSTPAAIANRAGLPAIAYRIGAYGAFRGSMMAGLSSAQFAGLAGLRTRQPDDFTIGLIDAVACAADVLTFYQERLANESYLRTATERISLQELGKLVSYRLRPGVAAEAWLAFALESPRTAPPNLPPEPGAFVTGIPEAVTLPSGLKVQSVPGPDEKPQIFETVEAVVARAEWSAMKALPDDMVVPADGDTETWLAGVDTQLKTGDLLVFVHAAFEADPTSTRWALRTVTEAAAFQDPARTHVRWVVPLSGIGARPLAPSSVRIVALRQRAAIFGHNAPDWPGLTDQYKAAYLGLESVEQIKRKQRVEWPQFNIYGPSDVGGMVVYTRMTARQAADILKADLRASADEVQRQWQMALGGLGAAVAGLVGEAFSIPVKIGQALLTAVQALPAALMNIFNPFAIVTGDPLAALNNVVGALFNVIGDSVKEVVNAVKAILEAVATLIETAIARTASSIYTPFMEGRIDLAAELPFATAKSVCDEAARSSNDALAKIPDYVVGVALSDPGSGALLLVVLAPLQSGFDFGTAGLQGTFSTFLAPTSQSLSQILKQVNPTNILNTGADMGLKFPSIFPDQMFEAAFNRMRGAARLALGRAQASLIERINEILRKLKARTFPGRTPWVVSLDRVYAGLIAPGYAALQTPNATRLYRLTRVAEASRAEFAVSAKSTLLTVTGVDLGPFELAVRETTALVDSQELALARTPLTTTIQGGTIEVAGAVTHLDRGRRIILRGRDVQSGQLAVHHATLIGAAVLSDRTRLEFTPQLEAPLLREGAVVFGNVALATHGETVSEILGSTDASRAFQRFELRRLPLTYRSSPDESGVDSELTVRIAEVEWNEVPSLYSAGPGDRAYTVRTDEQGRDWVMFGDGERGARPATGMNNVHAVHRQGVGRAGNVPGERLTQLMTRPMGLKSVSNPAPAENGADPQPAEQARRSIPLGTRTLGRAVSLRDYEDFALAFAGIAKAQARLLTLPSGPTIAMTVAGQDGDPVSVGGSTWRNLLAALRDSGDPHVSVVLLPHRRAVFRLGLKVRRDQAYAAEPLLAAVADSLRERFSFDRRDLGQPVMQSEVVAAAHAVPGVVAIDLDWFYNPAQTLRSRQTRLLASTMHVQNDAAVPAELLTLAEGPFDRLEEM